MQVDAEFAGRFEFIPFHFTSALAELEEELEQGRQYDGVLLDLGSLSMELDDEQRGLSVSEDIFLQDAPLGHSLVMSPCACVRIPGCVCLADWCWSDRGVEGC